MKNTITKYVLGNGTTPEFDEVRADDGFFRLAGDRTTLFGNVTEAARFMVSRPVVCTRIVRVLITTTTSEPQESRRVLGELEAPAEGEVALYALRSDIGFSNYDRGRPHWPSKFIRDAKLYHTHRDVLTDYRAFTSTGNPSESEGLRIVRIAVRTIPGGTTTDYTVEEIV